MYQPRMFNTDLIQNQGMNMIQMAMFAEKIKAMKEERERRERKDAFRTGLAQYYSSPEVQASMQYTEAKQGPIYKTPSDETEALMAFHGYPKDIKAKAEITFPTRKSPARVAADYALKAGYLEEFVELDRAARADENADLQENIQALQSVIAFRKSFGAEGLRQGWGVLESMYPKQLKGFDPEGFQWDDDANIVWFPINDPGTGKPAALVIQDTNHPEAKPSVVKLDSTTEGEEAYKIAYAKYLEERTKYMGREMAVQETTANAQMIEATNKREALEGAAKDTLRKEKRALLERHMVGEYSKWLGIDQSLYGDTGLKEIDIINKLYETDSSGYRVETYGALKSRATKLMEDAKMSPPVAFNNALKEQRAGLLEGVEPWQERAKKQKAGQPPASGEVPGPAKAPKITDEEREVFGKRKRPLGDIF